LRSGLARTTEEKHCDGYFKVTKSSSIPEPAHRAYFCVELVTTQRMETWRSGQVWLLKIYVFDALVRSPICSIGKPNQDWYLRFRSTIATKR
jgi:hypothetical protein